MATRSGSRPAARRVLVVAAAVALVGLALAVRFVPRAERHAVPRLVVVTFDTLSLRYATPYGARADLMPNLARLARRGLLVRHAYTTVPLTVPAHATMFSGRGPLASGVVHNEDRVPDELPLLAELMREAGYRTGGFIGLGVVNSVSNMHQGFEVFDDPFPAGARPWYRDADLVVARAGAWVREVREEPFFLWVHFSDPHGPYLPRDRRPDCELRFDGRTVGRYSLQSLEPHQATLAVPPGVHRLSWTSLRSRAADEITGAALAVTVERSPELAELAPDVTTRFVLGEPVEIALDNGSSAPRPLTLRFSGRLLRPPTAEVRANYASEVRQADLQLGRLVDLLGELGLRQDTLWLVASDHGEGLRYHRGLGHADQVFEDQLRIAWVLNGPGVPEGAALDRGPVLNEDVLPTLLDLLALRPPAGMTGRSLVGCWRGGDCPVRAEWWAYSVPGVETKPFAVAGYRWPFKLVDSGGELPDLFDLAADPWEERSLLGAAAEVPEPAAGLVRDLGIQRRALHAAVYDRPAPELDADRAAALRSLGYVN